VLCATFFPVLLLALVNRRNRGLEDVVFGTVVAYDWFPEVSEAHMDAQLDIEVARGFGSDRALTKAEAVIPPNVSQ
jgi:hypothetical protein